jgi:glycosyltransferase involved in cell wall biosynthesis
LRIAFITYEFPPDTGKGGIGTYTLQIAELLSKNHFDIHIFTGTQKPDYYTNVNNLNIYRVNSLNPHDFKNNVVSIFKTIHNIKPFDFIESPEIHGNAWKIKILFPEIPLIVKLHASNYLVEKLKKKYIPFGSKIRFLIGSLRRGKLDFGYWRIYNYKNDLDYNFVNLANIIIAPSIAMKNWAIINWKIPEYKIHVLPNPFTPSQSLLELPIFEIAINKEIVFFGRLNVLKGLVNATLAVKKILIEFPEYKFKVIGDDGAGPYFESTMREWMLMKFSDMQNRVTFIDGQNYDNIPKLIASAEIALLPSLFESFSYTCAEAMAAGKAVIGSKKTGMEDIIENNKTGLLIDPENVDDIYRSLKTLILNNTIRFEIAKAARLSILTKFNYTSSSNFIEFYKFKI